MFIRSKCDWKQTYFCLVEAYRDKNGKPRQCAVHLGKTVNLSAQEWAEVLCKVERNGIDRTTAKVFSAVRKYFKKQGQPLKIADAVRDGARLNRIAAKEQYTRMRTPVAHLRGYATVALLDAAEAEQKAREKAAYEKWEEALVDSYFGHKKAARLLGVTFPLTVEDVKAAYRTKAQSTHPDHGGDAEQFRKLTAARDMLFEYLGTTERQPAVPRVSEGEITA
jgi:hypothetical protein